MKNSNYFKFCEDLYKNWKKGDLPEKEVLKQLFQLDYVPEPYLYFEKGSNPLYVLYNNPGSGIDEIQKHDVVNEKTYDDFAKKISKYYLDKDKFKKETAAFNRIQKALNFAKNQGFDGVVNVETIPFHSVELNKKKALMLIKKTDLLQNYINALTSFLKDKPIIALSGCNTHESITKQTVNKNQWIKLQAEIIGFDLQKSKQFNLTEKADKVTSAIFKDQNKFLVLMGGSNNFPKSFNKPMDIFD